MTHISILAEKYFKGGIITMLNEVKGKRDIRNLNKEIKIIKTFKEKI